MDFKEYHGFPVSGAKTTLLAGDSLSLCGALNCGDTFSLDVLGGARNLQPIVGRHNGRHHAQVRCKVKLIRTDYSHVTRDVVTEQDFVSVSLVQPQGTSEDIRQVILTANESLVGLIVCPLPHLSGMGILRIAPAFLKGAGDRTETNRTG